MAAEFDMMIDLINMENDGTNPTLYVLQVTAGGSQWLLKKRYSQLADLHAALKKFSVLHLPEFPPKKAMGNRSEAFVKKRCAQLKQYVEALMQVAGVLSCEPFRVFFEVDTKVEATDIRRAPTEQWLLTYKNLVALCEDAEGAAANIGSGRSDEARLSSQLRTTCNTLTESICTLGEELDNGTIHVTGLEKIRRKGLLTALTQRKNDVLARVQQAQASKGSGPPGRAPGMGAGAAGPAAAGALAPPSAASQVKRRSKWGTMETEETAEMQSEELLQLQNKMMESQDQGLGELGKIMDRQMQMAGAIGRELDLHNEMLDNLSAHVDTTHESISTETKRVIKLNQQV